MKAILHRGTTITCINEKFYRRQQLQLIKNSSICVHQANSSTETLGRISVSLPIASMARDIQVHVFGKLKAELLLRLDTMALFSISMDLTSMIHSQSRHKSSTEAIVTDTTSTLQSKCERLDESKHLEFLAPLEKQAFLFCGSRTDNGGIALEQHATVSPAMYPSTAHPAGRHLPAKRKWRGKWNHFYKSA